MTPGLLAGQARDCIARDELQQHHRQLHTDAGTVNSSTKSGKTRLVVDLATTAIDQERRGDCVVVEVVGGFDVGERVSQLGGEYSRASGSTEAARRLSSNTYSDPLHLPTIIGGGNLSANISTSSTASSSASVELANQGTSLESPSKQNQNIYDPAKAAYLDKQAVQQQLDYSFHNRNFHPDNHNLQQQNPHHQTHSISAMTPKIVDHQQFTQNYVPDRLVNSYSSSLPTFMLASHHHHQLKLDHVAVNHYNPISTGVGGDSTRSIVDGTTGDDTGAKNCFTAAPSGNSNTRAETVAPGPMIARAHQLQATRSANCLNQNYASYTNLMNSSKSSSPNSSNSSPSPKSSAMQTLSTNHSFNQLLPTGFNQSAAASAAMVAAESHLGHINQHYFSSNTSNAELTHSHQQQHYAYSAQQTAALATPSHHQHHHIGGVVPQDQVTAEAAYNHIQHQQQQQHQQQHQHQQQSHQMHQQRQQHQQEQHQHQQQQHQSNMTGQQQSFYHQIVDSSISVGSTHGYAAATTNNNVPYHSQLHASNNQANNLISDASQSHLNNAAAACAAAAVVSQTLKTVANQHNQHHQHQYGGTINNGFSTGTNLMSMATKQHHQFHPMSAALGQHHNQHLVHGTQSGAVGPQHSQMHHHPQSQQHAQNIPAHHQASSIIARKYQCKMCPQVFMSKAEMKYHNQNHLREAKPYKCLQCPKAFANSSYLSQHMRIHQGLKPYTCDICTRKFTQLSHLQQHKRTHTGDKPYKCNYMNCTKQFSQLSNLQSHSRCHQLDKPYKCNSCYKCFHDEHSLLEHIPRHLESKHLKKNLCIFCGSSYQQERGLVKHFQQYHTDKTPTLVAAAIAAGTTGNTTM